MLVILMMILLTVMVIRIFNDSIKNVENAIKTDPISGLCKIINKNKNYELTSARL
jgi:hypothetical protein